MTPVSVHLLVVEDDDSVRAALRLALEGEGYAVSEAASAERALSAFALDPPEMMLVDLMLGEMSGFDCIRHVRRTSDIPIVVVSARDDTHDVVAGLEAGADDYVTKPFHVKEITARLRALRRRSARWSDAPAGPGAAAPPGPISLAEEAAPADVVVLDAGDPPLVLDAAAGRLLRGTAPVHVTLTEFRLLSELAED